MGKGYLLVFAILIIILVGLINVSAQSQCLQNAQNDNKTLYFFYGSECPHCKAAEPFLLSLKNKYNLTIIYHETWHNSSNQQIFEEFLTAYNVPKNSWAVPGFFMGSRHIIGFDNPESIGKNLEEIIKSCLNNNCQGKSSLIRFSLFGKNIEISRDYPLFFIGIILGFADGFNPCTFSILIFLLGYLFTLSASKSKILKLGLTFTFVIFIVYISIMLGLVNIVSFIGFRGIGKTIIGIVLLLIAAINIKDFFLKGIGPSLEIPKFARPLLENYVKKATVPAVIILAVILSFVELGCTLGLPLAYVSIMAEKGITGIQGLLYIILYNLFYIMPLLIILFLVYFFVLETDKAEHYRQRLRRWTKLFGGLLMLLLGIMILFNIL